MRIRITEIIYKSNNEIKVLKDENFDIQFLPMKGDIIFLDGIRYKVEERNFIEMGAECIILFVSRTY